MSLISKKICIIGESDVGKNSLIRRFVDRQFSDEYLTTVGVKLSQKTIEFQGVNPSDKLKIRLLIWNVTGHHKFKAIAPTYLRSSIGAVAVADITRPETLERLPEHIHRFSTINPKGFILVALNKWDLIEQEKQEKIIQDKTLPNVLGLYPTSAKTGLGVDEIFLQTAKQILESCGKGFPPFPASPHLDGFSNQKRGGEEKGRDGEKMMLNCPLDFQSATLKTILYRALPRFGLLQMRLAATSKGAIALSTVLAQTLSC
jgi:small GTP-binding protein